eukprot:scaffold121160_cov32-Tisochrysis_lutea.AAC.1
MSSLNVREPGTDWASGAFRLMGARTAMPLDWAMRLVLAATGCPSSGTEGLIMMALAEEESCVPRGISRSPPLESCGPSPSTCSAGGENEASASEVSAIEGRPR